MDFARFREFPISAVTPEGWLRRALELQRDGITGHLHRNGYPFNTKGWAGVVPPTQGCDWWPYEQTGYWVDGMVRCAHLLRDSTLLERGLAQIEYVLRHPDRDGYLGPKHIKVPESMNRWAHAVFFRAMMAHHSATGDARIPEAIRRHYLSHTSPHVVDREVCNIEAMCWAAGVTGDKRLIRDALKARQGFNEVAHKYHCGDVTDKGLLSGKRPTIHGVSFAEMAKTPAILAMYTGQEDLARISVHGFRKADRFSMLVDGIPSGSEALRGREPLDAHETCDVADFPWAWGYLLMATGAAEWADRIERACFNAAPGCVLPDFRGLQYFSCPNQVLADDTSNHVHFQRGNGRMAFWPNHNVECCPGEVNRIMPNYIARMWMSGTKDEVAAVLYGPSRLETRLGPRQTPVTIVEDTQFPFSDCVEFQVRAAQPVRFAFTLRIPGWCRAAQVRVNGAPAKGAVRRGTFLTLNREWQPNDRVTLVLPMEVALSRWPQQGVALERGPLVYSLRIAERRELHTQEADQFPAWNFYPDSPWNYALAVDPDRLDEVEIVQRMAPALEPWRQENAAIELRVPARRVRGWGLAREKGKRFTPALPDAGYLRKNLASRTETIALIPYGCTRLRLTVFPDAGR